MIEIDDNQARLFRLLSECGAWDVKNGSVEIHIDAQGTPVRVEVRQVFASLSTRKKRVEKDVDIKVVL